MADDDGPKLSTHPNMKQFVITSTIIGLFFKSQLTSVCAH